VEQNVDPKPKKKSTFPVTTARWRSRPTRSLWCGNSAPSSLSSRIAETGQFAQLTKAEFVAAVQALGEGGVTDVAFYNWGHVRSANLQWIAAGVEALRSFG
jgi:hypothetical protein